MLELKPAKLGISSCRPSFNLSMLELKHTSGFFDYINQLLAFNLSMLELKRK